MPDHSLNREASPVNVETRHETSDVNTRALLWSVVVFIVFAVLTHVLLLGFFHGLTGHFRHQASEPLTMMGRPSPIPPTPRLQPFASTTIPPNANTPVTDMVDMRTAQDQALNKAAWVDQQKGVVTIPIETAKQLVVQRGLPVVKEGAP